MFRKLSLLVILAANSVQAAPPTWEDFILAISDVGRLTGLLEVAHGQRTTTEDLGYEREMGRRWRMALLVAPLAQAYALNFVRTQKVENMGALKGLLEVVQDRSLHEESSENPDPFTDAFIDWSTAVGRLTVIVEGLAAKKAPAPCFTRLYLKTIRPQIAELMRELDADGG